MNNRHLHERTLLTVELADVMLFNIPAALTENNGTVECIDTAADQ